MLRGPCCEIGNDCHRDQRGAKQPSKLLWLSWPKVTILARRLLPAPQQWNSPELRKSHFACVQSIPMTTLLLFSDHPYKCFTGTDSFPQISLTTLLPSFSEWVWIFPLWEGGSTCGVYCCFPFRQNPLFLIPMFMGGVVSRQPQPQPKPEEVLTDLNQSA